MIAFVVFNRMKTCLLVLVCAIAVEGVGGE